MCSKNDDNFDRLWSVCRWQEFMYLRIIIKNVPLQWCTVVDIVLTKTMTKMITDVETGLK